MCHHWTDAGWAIHVLDSAAKVRAPTTNQNRNSRWYHLLSISTWYDTVLWHDRSIVLSAREETVLLVGGCKIYQT